MHILQLLDTILQELPLALGRQRLRQAQYHDPLGPRPTYYAPMRPAVSFGRYRPFLPQGIACLDTLAQTGTLITL
jgi:hypothetical protein